MIMPTSTAPNNSWKDLFPTGSLQLLFLRIVTEFSKMKMGCSVLVDFSRHIGFNTIDKTAENFQFLVQIHPILSGATAKNTQDPGDSGVSSTKQIPSRRCVWIKSSPLS